MEQHNSAPLPYFLPISIKSGTRPPGHGVGHECDCDITPYCGNPKCQGVGAFAYVSKMSTSISFLHCRTTVS